MNEWSLTEQEMLLFYSKTLSNIWLGLLFRNVYQLSEVLVLKQKLRHQLFAYCYEQHALLICFYIALAD